MNLFESLTEQELSLLDDMLLNRNDDHEVAQGQDEGVLCISELDGILTAIVSGPIVLPPPSRWIPALRGDIEPAWEGAKEFETFMSLVMRHSNSIVDLLMDDSAAFEPMCEEREVEGKVIRLVDEWCKGHLRGVGLCVFSPHRCQNFTHKEPRRAILWHPPENTRYPSYPHRWPHGYAYDYNPLFDSDHGPGQAPHEIGRQTFGNIAIANSDAGARAYLDEAIDQAYRAVGELQR